MNNNPDPADLRAYAELLELGIASDKATEAAIVALRFYAAMIEAAAEVDGFFSEKH